MTVISEAQTQQIIGILTGQITPTSRKETHVGIVLDASGSMESIRSEIIGAFNAQIDTLKKTEVDMGTVLVTFVTFGEHGGAVLEKYRAQPLARLEKLTYDTYIPSGMTPFYDALGLTTTILEGYDVFDGVNRAFLVSTFTDGMENASKEWSIPGRLKGKVEEREKTGRWTFTYAGANVNLAHVAAATGINVNNMVGYDANAVGVRNVTHNHSTSLGSFSQLRAAGGTASASFYAPAPDIGELQKILEESQKEAARVNKEKADALQRQLFKKK